MLFKYLKIFKMSCKIHVKRTNQVGLEDRAKCVKPAILFEVEINTNLNVSHPIG